MIFATKTSASACLTLGGGSGISFIRYFKESYTDLRIVRRKQQGYTHIGLVFMLIIALGAGYFLLRMNAAKFFTQLKDRGRLWLYDHVFKMASAITALVSASAGSLLKSMEPFNQILPAILGTMWLVFCLIY